MSDGDLVRKLICMLMNSSASKMGKYYRFQTMELKVVHQCEVSKILQQA